MPPKLLPPTPDTSQQFKSPLYEVASSNLC